MKYVFNFSGMYPLYLTESSMNRFIELNNIFKINAKKWSITFSVDGCAFSYSLEEDKKALREISKLYLNKKFADKVFLESKKLCNQYWDFIANINKLENLSSKELLDIFLDLHRLVSKVFCFFDITRPEYQDYITERLEKLTKEYFEDKDVINKLVLPVEQDEIIKGHNEFLRICVSSASDEDLLKFGYKNIWLFPEIRDESELLEHFKSQREDIKSKDIEEVKKKISESQNVLESRKKEQEELFNEANNEELKYLSKLFQNLGLERVRQKKCWMDSRSHMEKMLSYISKIKSVPKKDLSGAYTIQDLMELINENKKLEKSVIESRKHKYAFVFENDSISFWEGEEAKKIIDPILLEQGKSTQIKGSPAFLGKVTGRVVFVPNADLESLSKNIKEFKKGDILLTQMTQPNMVILAEKAAAIITDEGGIASHAAIISREFKIPCIVGTGNATQLLKTGDIVEVDANKGIVRRLE